jgi:3-deoxy-D-manno-octulosonic-acid transferase
MLPFTPMPTPAAAVWLHAVSVGEVLSSIPLITELRARYPKAPVYVSCGTVAGRLLAREKLRGIAEQVFYAPLDYRSCVRRTLRAIKPALVLIVETEIWPNLYREIKRSGARLLIVNGRISDRAFPRYRRMSWFFRAPLAMADCILVQSERDRERYIQTGAPEERIVVAGNLKYDAGPPRAEIAADITALLDRLKPAEICIAASTMPPRSAGDVDEDDAVIAAFQELAGRSGLLLIHAPRRPERFDAAASKLERAGVRFVRRSALGGAVPDLRLPAVLLLDSIGELSRMFAAADVVFMGGTLARRGGHNILEPAYFAKPVIVGPHMENFADIAEEFTQAGGLVQISSPAELAAAIKQLLDSPEERAAVGFRARALAQSKGGVAQRIAGEALKLYFEALPASCPRGWLAPLAWIWGAGVRRDRARRLARQKKLERPVISVGAMTMGGAGKTPFVAWLAARLYENAHQPAVLTRGYRRRSVQDKIIISAGAACSPELTGDEAQIFVRSGIAHVGIGRNRYETGRLLEERLDPDVFLLDDGFQHWPLARELDIVLIDALDPFGGGAAFPRGRLREPLDGLARADAFVITRTEPGVSTAAIERTLRTYNRRAPVFRARIIPSFWRDLHSGRSVPASGAPFRAVAAFCGIGNPGAFWRTLDALGLSVVYQCCFPDHHRYQPRELRRLAVRAAEAGADALVTTEKDAINLSEYAGQVAGSAPVYWLKIGVELDNEAQFLALVLENAGAPSAGLGMR